MRSVILLLFIVGYSAIAAAADPTLLQRLTSAGFQCSADANGNMCINSTPHVAGFNYTQPVVVLVPPNVEHPARVLLYLHGFRGVCEAADTSAAGMVSEFNFVGQMQQAHATNAVMIIPISLGNCVTYTAEFVPQFVGFQTWMTSVIAPASNLWTVSGHSGAGAMIAPILANNAVFTATVKAVILLDAAYSMPDHIAQWQQASTHNANFSIYSVYTTPDGTQPGSEQLKTTLKNKVVIAPANPDVHCQVPDEWATLLGEADPSLATDMVKGPLISRLN